MICQSEVFNRIHIINESKEVKKKKQKETLGKVFEYILHLLGT